MAYNNYYPMQYHPFQQALQQNYAQALQAQQNYQQAAYGLIPVRGEEEARSYPVAPNNSLTFRDETGPYIYSKAMGASQLDSPVFEKYRLVKEETPQREKKEEAHKEESHDEYALKRDLDALRASVEEMKMRMEATINE